MMKEILDAAELYAQGLKQIEAKRDQWIEKTKELKAHLKEIADYLNTNATYKQGFYVDTLHAFNEHFNGTCNQLSSVTFRSGDMPMLVTFKNNMGEKKDLMEHGFRIAFNPTVTGQVAVLLYPHDSELNEQEPAFGTITVIDEPGKLTMDVVDKIIAKGMQVAFYSSFTGISQQAAPQETVEQVPTAKYTPIGFKHHETTQKNN